MSNATGNFELYTVPAAGGKPAQVTNTAEDERSPAWTPDGKRLIYQLTQGNSDLWTVEVSGLLKRR